MEETSFHVPDGWPVVEPGIMMAGLGPLLFIWIGSAVEDVGWGHHLTELERALTGMMRPSAPTIPKPSSSPRISISNTLPSSKPPARPSNPPDSVKLTRASTGFSSSQLRAVRPVPIGILYEIEHHESNARRRKMTAEFLLERRDLLKANVASLAMCSSSPMVHGAMQAIFWLAPPPYQHSMFSSVRDGLFFLSQQVGGIEPSRLEEQYRKLQQRNLVA